MTVRKTPPEVAALNRHGRDTLMSHPGVEFTGAGKDFLRARIARSSAPGSSENGLSRSAPRLWQSAWSGCC